MMCSCVNVNLEEIGDKLLKFCSIFDKNFYDKMEVVQIFKEEVNENFSNEILLYDLIQQVGYVLVVGLFFFVMFYLRNMIDFKSVEEWINIEFGGVEIVLLL